MVRLTLWNKDRRNHSRTCSLSSPVPSGDVAQCNVSFSDENKITDRLEIKHGDQ